jgi:hypothetical protein
MKLNVLLALPLVFLAGCGLLFDDAYVQVTDTPLNWCEVHYYNATRDPVRRTSVRVTGSGLVEVKTGTSRLVSDSFAKNMSDETWGDITKSQYTVEPDHVRAVFQNLVNAGLFDRDKMFTSTKHPSPGRFIAVRAAFDNKTFSEPYNMFEEDPELAERLYNLVLEFSRPVVRKRKPSYGRGPAKEKEAKK